MKQTSNAVNQFNVYLYRPQYGVRMIEELLPNGNFADGEYSPKVDPLDDTSDLATAYITRLTSTYFCHL